jgi:hypothetical protein
MLPFHQRRDRTGTQAHTVIQAERGEIAVIDKNDADYFGHASRTITLNINSKYAFHLHPYDQSNRGKSCPV